MPFFLSLLFYNSPVLAMELVTEMTMEMTMGMVMVMDTEMGIGEKEQAKMITMVGMMVMGMATMKLVMVMAMRRTIMDGNHL